MGILIYSQEEARRNAFAVKKFEEHLGVKLVTPDYDGDCKFVINRTNDYKIAEKFESFENKKKTTTNDEEPKQTVMPDSVLEYAEDEKWREQ